MTWLMAHFKRRPHGNQKPMTWHMAHFKRRRYDTHAAHWAHVGHSRGEAWLKKPMTFMLLTQLTQLVQHMQLTLTGIPLVAYIYAKYFRDFLC